MFTPSSPVAITLGTPHSKDITPPSQVALNLGTPHSEGITLAYLLGEQPTWGYYTCVLAWGTPHSEGITPRSQSKWPSELALLGEHSHFEGIKPLPPQVSAYLKLRLLWECPALRALPNVMAHENFILFYFIFIFLVYTQWVSLFLKNEK